MRLVGLDPRAALRLRGWGIRKPEPLLEFFERVINLIRIHAPQAAIGLNSTGENSVEAMLRCLPRKSQC